MTDFLKSLADYIDAFEINETIEADLGPKNIPDGKPIAKASKQIQKLFFAGKKKFEVSSAHNMIAMGNALLKLSGVDREVELEALAYQGERTKEEAGIIQQTMSHLLSLQFPLKCGAFHIGKDFEIYHMSICSEDHGNITVSEQDIPQNIFREFQNERDTLEINDDFAEKNEPEGEIEKNEQFVSFLSDNAKRIKILANHYEKESQIAQHCTQIAILKDQEEDAASFKLKCLRMSHRANILTRIFWEQCRAENPLVKTASIGVRKGWKLVKLPEQTSSLGRFLTDFLGGFFGNMFESQ